VQPEELGKLKKRKRNSFTSSGLEPWPSGFNQKGYGSSFMVRTLRFPNKMCSGHRCDCSAWNGWTVIPS
jgi:hypothetical protein